MRKRLNIKQWLLKPKTILFVDYVKNELKINASNGESLAIEIINSQGQVIEQKQNLKESESLKLSKYNSGIYFYTISNKEKTERGKFLILD